MQNCTRERSHLKAKVLGVVITILVLGVSSILAYNWKTTVPTTTQTTTAPKTGSVSMRIKIPVNGCYIGAFAGYEDLTPFENMVGKKMAMRNVYYAWGYGFPSKALESMMKPDMILVLSWVIALHNVTAGRANIPIRFQDIIDGKYDSFLHDWAKNAKSFSYPILLRPGYEMNVGPNLWSGANNFGKYGNESWRQVDDLNKYYGDPLKPDGPERFADAGKHMWKIFNDEKAMNVVWVWCPHYVSDPYVDWNKPENYYPGDDYVDWVGCDLYTSYSGKQSDWTDFNTRFKLYYGFETYNRHRNEPFILAELGCSEETPPGMAAAKAKWITDAFNSIKNSYPNIKSVCWFSADNRGLAAWERDWRVNSSPETLEAFRKAISDPYFLDKVMFGSVGLAAPSSILHCTVVTSISHTWRQKD